MIVLVDYNLNGYIVLIQGTLAAGGWLDLLSIQFVTLDQVGLAANTDDWSIENNVVPGLLRLFWISKII
jgi:hypothetical protein